MRMTAAIALVLLTTTRLPAYDADDVSKHRAAILETAKTLKLKAAPIVETADLLVIGTLPEAKVKTIAAAAQKAVEVARANLQFKKDDELLAGKLAVYVLADYAELKEFIRTLEQRKPNQAASTMNLRGRTPYVAVSPELGAKLVDADLSALAAGNAAAAVLNKKVGITPGAEIPDWLQDGYGRACFVRSETTAKQTAQRAKLKTLLVAKSKVGFTVKDLWGNTSVADHEMLAGSFVEYLAFVAFEEKFAGFVRLAKGAADEDKPLIDAALATLEITPENLDLAWKTWVVKGK